MYLAGVLPTVSEIISFIGTEDYIVFGDKDLAITGFKPISSARQGEMTFCSVVGKESLKLISSSKASLIICHVSLKKSITNTNSTLIFVGRPRLWFSRCVKRYNQPETLHGIHPSAIVESKGIGKNVYIGPFTFVGKNVTIGDNTIIHGGVHIYGNTSIGKNVIIDSCTVIGADGFGFEKNESLEWEKFPHLGGIEIQDNVEVGANVCIDRGTLENTVIGAGSKIDNLVHIAHNVKVGRNCIIIAQSLVAGSCILEDNAYVAMSAVIRNHVKVGKNAIVGMGAVVTKNVADGVTVIGVPAHPIRKKHNKKSSHMAV